MPTTVATPADIAKLQLQLDAMKARLAKLEATPAPAPPAPAPAPAPTPVVPAIVPAPVPAPTPTTPPVVAPVPTTGEVILTHGYQMPRALAEGHIGLRPGVALTNVGTSWTPVANTTYENLLIPKAFDTGNTPGVTLINCHIRNNGGYRVIGNGQGGVTPKGTLTLKRCLIDGNGGADAGIAGSNIRVERSVFRGCLKDMHINDDIVVIECLMNNHPAIPASSTTHAECILRTSGKNLTVQRCYMVYAAADQVSAAIAVYNQPDCDTFILEDSFVSGGGYAVYGGGATNTRNVKIRRNIFSREQGRYSGWAGPMDFSGAGTPGFEFVGNVWGPKGPENTAADPAPGTPINY